MQSFSYFDRINFKGIGRHSKLERGPFFKTQFKGTHCTLLNDFKHDFDFSK
jgi:hypothetical protein